MMMMANRKSSAFCIYRSNETEAELQHPHGAKNTLHMLDDTLFTIHDIYAPRSVCVCICSALRVVFPWANWRFRRQLCIYIFNFMYIHLSVYVFINARRSGAIEPNSPCAPYECMCVFVFVLYALLQRILAKSKEVTGRLCNAYITLDPTDSCSNALAG